ncbi:MAG: DsbA family protein [Methanobrevibacter sp.]|nr:DsbA family protein [Methanobrevibacter sp.]
MRIIYFIDYNCPYSYIGLKRLQKAVENVGADVEWEMRSFELEPTLGKRQNKTTAENYAEKHDVSLKEAEAEIAEIERIAQEDSLKINYKDMLLVSSKDALRLTKFAQNRHPEVTLELINKIFEANLVKNENIYKTEILKDIAISCGIEEYEALKILDQNYYNIEMELDKEDAINSGITATPCFIFVLNEDKLIIPGTFSTGEFETALNDMISGEIENKTFV